MKSGAVLAGIFVLGAIIVLLVVVMLTQYELAGPTWAGIGIGAALGTLNLFIGTALTGRALKRSNQAVLRTMLGGFFIRLLALVGLIFAFNKLSWINETAFALAFMVFFCLFLAVEIRIIDRSLRRVA